MNSRVLVSALLGILFFGIVASFLFLRRDTTLPLPPTPTNVTLPTVTVPVTDPTIEKEKGLALKQLQEEDEKKSKELLLLESALNKGDIALCGGITTPSIQDECTGKITIASVAKSGNLESCSSLTGAYLGACKDEVYFYQGVGLSSGSTLEKHKICSKIGNQGRQDDCIVTIERFSLTQEMLKDGTVLTEKYCQNLVDTGSRSRCQEIRNDQLENQARIQASSSSDIHTCEALKEPILIASCQDGIIYAEARKNSSVGTCERIQGVSLKNQCTQEVFLFQDQSTYKDARTKSDINLCESIRSTEIRELCTREVRFELAMSTRDMSFCEGTNDTARCREAVTLLNSQ